MCNIYGTSDCLSEDSVSLKNTTEEQWLEIQFNLVLKVLKHVLKEHYACTQANGVNAFYSGTCHRALFFVYQGLQALTLQRVDIGSRQRTNQNILSTVYLFPRRRSIHSAPIDHMEIRKASGDLGCK